MDSAIVKLSAQDLADTTVQDEFRQTVKTAEQCVAELGWQSADEPTCCGTRVSVRTCLGDPYFAECKTCRKFMVSVFAPVFGNASVQFIDPDKVDVDTDAHWITGVQGLTS